MMVIHHIDWIISDEKIRNGRPIIAGTSLTVADIATIKIFHGKDADEIAEWFGIPLQRVYAALAYYYEHKEEIDQDIRARDQIAVEYREKRIGSKHDPLLP